MEMEIEIEIDQTDTKVLERKQRTDDQMESCGAGICFVTYIVYSADYY